MKRILLSFSVMILLTVDISAQRSLTLEVTQINADEFPRISLRLQVRRQGAVPVQLADLLPLVTENGTPQMIHSLECPNDDSLRLSITILLDRSGSMARFADRPNVVDPDSTKMRDAKRAISGFLDLLTPRDEAGVFTFTTTGLFQTHLFTVEHDFSTDVASLKRCLVPIVALGGTRMWEAVIDAVQRLRVRAGRKAMILVTDGRNTQGNNFRLPAMQAAMDAGIPVYSIGIGGDVDVDELTALSQATNGRFYDSPGSAGLEAIFTEIADELITDECILRYITSDTCADATNRYVDVQISAAGLLAEDNTSYRAPDRRESVMLSAELPDSTLSRGQLNFPLKLTNIETSSAPISCTMTIHYDNTLMQWSGIETIGTMSEGATIHTVETVPGTVEIEMPALVADKKDRPLFFLVFNVFAVSDRQLTTISLNDVQITTECPVIVQKMNGHTVVLPCEESFTLGGDAQILVIPEETFRVEMYIEPQPTIGDRLLYRGSVRFDKQLLQYEGITLDGSIVDGSTLVTGGDGFLDVTIDGEVKDTSRILATLRFSAETIRNAELTRISFDEYEFRTACQVTADWKPVDVYIDGVCQPLVRKKNSAPFTNYPNPVVGVTVFTYSVPVEGLVRLFVLDAHGKQIRQLLYAKMPVGSYTHHFDAVALPAGEYLCVLEHPHGCETRKILILR